MNDDRKFIVFSTPTYRNSKKFFSLKGVARANPIEFFLIYSNLEIRPVPEPIISIYFLRRQFQTKK